MLVRFFNIKRVHHARISETPAEVQTESGLEVPEVGGGDNSVVSMRGAIPAEVQTKLGFGVPAVGGGGPRTEVLLLSPAWAYRDIPEAMVIREVKVTAVVRGVCGRLLCSVECVAALR